MNDETFRLGKKLQKICPILKDVSVRMGYENGSSRPSRRHYVNEIIVRDFDFSDQEDSIWNNMTVKVRRDSPFKFKMSRMSYWEIYRDYENPIGEEEGFPEDEDFVVDTYYAIVEAENIPKFIKESGEMWNGEDQIDPLGDGMFHSARVYVISDEVLPMGLGELISRKKESRNLYLGLILTKKSVEEFIKKHKGMESFFKNNPDIWLGIC